jgi:hypothetical protein
MSKEHEVTKTMLNIIRDNEAKRRTSINENDNDIIDLTGEELKGEEKKFMEIVYSGVKFGPYKIYPNSSNVVFSGQMDNGIEWQFSKVDGVYVNLPNIELTDEIVELTKKLKAYFENWDIEWGKKLNTEYKSNDR